MGGIKGNPVWRGHKAIMHIDMDAFFAAVEQEINPGLKGRPVIVGGPSDSRGVVSTCSYEARNYGVHSAMPMKQAYRLCPQAVFIDTSGGKYSYLSVRILNILKNYSPNVEPVSIDEAFVDITGVHQRYGGPEKLAVYVKRDIKNKCGLTASIGIAPNRFVAKMASSANKPDGMVIIPPDEVRQFLWVQPVRHLWGVGPKSEEAFKKNGIDTIGDLAKTGEGILKRMFGIVGPALKKMATGEGEDDVRPSDIEHEAKSMGHEHTFSRDTNNPDEVIGLLLYLSDRVSRRLRQSGCEGKTVTLKIRKSSFKLITRAVTLREYFDTEKAIFQAAKTLLMSNRFLDGSIRLIGVSVSNLRSKKDLYFDELLSGDDPRRKSEKIDKLLDRLRDRHGEESIFFACSQLF
jgi:DNA polymerase-4